MLRNLKNLDKRVILEIFTQEGENDPYNEFTTQFISEFSNTSEKIETRLNTIGDKKSKKYDVTRSPTILFNPDKYSIRFSGALLGEEGRSFIQTIFMVSIGESDLSLESRERLATLKENRQIQVFVMPSCPYCPGQVINANAAAIEKPDLISSECIEAVENADLAKKFNVGSVPRDRGISTIWDSVVEEIHGDETVKAFKIRNTKNEKVEEMEVEGVFLAIGEKPNSELAKDIGIKVDDFGYIIVDRNQRTNIPRVYAAGDVTGGIRQIVSAIGEGTTAALSAFEDLAQPYWKTL